jgi:branched-chain amino acid transport system ATP-binding protein
MIGALNVDKLRLDTGDYVLSVQAMEKRIGVRRVLERIDLDVKRAAFVALVGPAGAGKSLALACIAGARQPTRGRVRYFGYELRGRGEERIARLGVVRTHQIPQPFGDMTVFESVVVGALLRRPSQSQAAAYAREILALTELTYCSERHFAQLDACARRRLGLARALATEPQVLLLDDIAAGLDERALMELGAIVTGVRARGITIVAAARSLDRIPAIADDVVEINRGQTAEVGLHAAIDIRT